MAAISWPALGIGRGKTKRKIRVRDRDRGRPLGSKIVCTHVRKCSCLILRNNSVPMTVFFGGLFICRVLNIDEPLRNVEIGTENARDSHNWEFKHSSKFKTFFLVTVVSFYRLQCPVTGSTCVTTRCVCRIQENSPSILKMNN